MTSSTFMWLLHRQIGGLLSLENSAGVDADLTSQLRKTASVAHKAAGCSELTKLGDRRHRVAGCQYAELFAPTNEECVGSDHERANPQLRQCCENRVEVTITAGV